MPGKIAHLVPMQRFDSVIVRRTLAMTKSSNPDYNLSTKLPALTTQPSTDDSIGMSWPIHQLPTSASSPPHPPPPLHTSTSINSLKPSYDQTTNVNTNDSENILSQTRLQTMLSRFRQELESTPYRNDLKRSSV